MRKLLVILSCTLCTVVQADEVRIWVEATINNQPVRLAFDTGAPDFWLFRRTAERLKLQLLPLPPEDQMPSGPMSVTALTESVEFSFGSLKDRTQFYVLNDPPEQAPTQAEGQLSWSRLRSRIFVFDPAGPNLTIGDSVPERARDWPRFKLRSDAVVLGFESGLDDAGPHTIYVDTGAAYGVALNHALWTQWLAAHPNQPASISAGFSPGVGTLILTEMWAKEITVGSLHLTEVPVHELTAREEASPLFVQPAAVLGLYAVGRLDLVVDGQTATVYARPTDSQARPYSHNHLGALFMPLDPQTRQSDPLVAHVAPNSPASSAGIRDGDILLRIDDLDVTQWQTNPAVMPLRRFWEHPATYQLTLKRGPAESQTKVVLKSILGPQEPPNIVPEIGMTEGMVQQMMRDEMPPLPQPTRTGRSALDTYDLMQATDEVMKKVTTDEKFSAYLEQRKKSLSPEQLQTLDLKTQGVWMVEYAQTREDVKPEIKAWLYVLSGPYAAWADALAGYYRLEKFRPNDFIPALLLAFKLQAPGMDPPSAGQWKDLVGIVRRALPRTSNTEDQADCVASIAVGALKLQQAGKGQDVPLPMIWEWVRGVQLPEAKSEDVLRLHLVKWELAMAAKDFMAAVELSPRCRLRAFQPLLLEFAGQRDQAYSRLQELRRDSSLTEPERVGLRKFAPLVLIFSHRLDEAWKTIREQRQAPRLTTKDSEWLDMMERLLRQYETAIRQRENKQPQ